jgi:hypothetical protein
MSPNRLSSTDRLSARRLGADGEAVLDGLRFAGYLQCPTPDMAEPVAIIMAKALQKDEQWIKEQVVAYTKLAEGYLLKG